MGGPAPRRRPPARLHLSAQVTSIPRATMSRRQPIDHEAPALFPWGALLRGHAAVRRTLAAQLQAAHGLTLNDYEALLLLSRAEENCMRRVDLADGLQLTASGVTRLLDGLEGHGLVDKA